MIGMEATAPRRRKPWGLIDLFWGLLALVGSQMVLLPVLVVLLIAEGKASLADPNATTELTNHVTQMLSEGPGMVLALLVQWAAFVGAAWLASHRKGHRSLAKDFGFFFRRVDPLWGIGLAVGMQLVLAAAQWALSHTSLDLSGADNTGMVTGQAGIYLIIMALGACIGAPLTEELLFRGLILRAFLRAFAKVDLAPVLPGVTDKFHPARVSTLRRRVGTVVAVLGSAACFGAAHTPVGDAHHHISALAYIVLASQTGLLGAVFAVVAIRVRRLGVTICAHVTFNSISIGLALLAAHH